MSDSTEEQVTQQDVMSMTVPRFESGSVGARLARAREQKTWTVQYVAEQLKLSQSQIVALEADQFEKLPKLVIVRGFVRAYAKLLRIDATELMQLMPQDTETVALETSLRPALATPFIEPRASLTGQQENNKRYVIGILVLLVLVALTLFLQRTEYGQQVLGLFSATNRTSTSTDAPSVPLVSTPDIVQVSGSTASQTVVASEPVNSFTQTSASSANVVDGVAAASSVPALTTPSAEASPSNVLVAKPESIASAASTAEKVVSEKVTTDKNVSPAKADKLVLKFKHDSWLFVKANGGAVLTSRMVRAGAEESFDVKQGLFVKIGNAVDVEASLRGEPLTVQTERDSKVATLTVK